MMPWMRRVVLASVAGMGRADLDYLHDETANSVGAMLLHLAGLDGFTNSTRSRARKWATGTRPEGRKWNAAVNLGAKPAGRSGATPRLLPGHLHETREKPWLN
jgi:hypothetical protein